MVSALRTAHGMRERSAGVWEVIVQAGRDPVTGRYRQVTRTVHGTLRDARAARAELLVEVGKGRHKGTGATVDELFADWIVELERKGRSPNTIHGYEKKYRHDVQPTLGSVAVTKVTTKMLTDLYGAHQKRGLAPRSVYQVHACLSSMLTQACRWGWRDSNPAQWAETPAPTHTTPIVPTPDEVVRLVAEAERSRRPEKARAMFLAATTGLRRAELVALRRQRDIDWSAGSLRVAWSIAALPGQPLREIPTKNRRTRDVALDALSLSMLRAQVEMMEDRARDAGCTLSEDAFLFSDAADGSVPWKPDTMTQFFMRVRSRVGLDQIDLHQLRKFMATYGQTLGFSPVQVALRAGHDPSVAARNYTGSVREADRALAAAIAGLLTASNVPTPP